MLGIRFSRSSTWTLCGPLVTAIMSKSKFLPLLSAPGLLQCSPKRVVLSGPSGFLGTHVLDSLLEVHQLRKENGLEPGEITLLSSSPGNTMKRLQKKYGEDKMKTVRASRVDYFTQHDCETWRDQLGSLGNSRADHYEDLCSNCNDSFPGLKGENVTFVNLAAVAGPVTGIADAMMDVNYRAPVAAAKACEILGFGHFIQSSTQATSAERAGQVHM
jgi:nucleoside-diphosphate-sugar epimerase